MDLNHAKWNEQQKRLREIILKPAFIDETRQLCLEQHMMVHAAELSQIALFTFEDGVWEGLTVAAFRAMPVLGAESIAWNIWHITRVEDITMNLLVAGESQVMNAANWLERLRITVRDTGNAMTAAEVADFSSRIDMDALRSYRIAVGRKTRKIIERLTPFDLKRKMEAERLQQILDEGAVLDVPGAKGLIDFWGSKDVAGLLLMPVTRHPLVHLNESMRLRERWNKGSKGL